MPTPQEIQRNAQFQQLLASLDQISEVLVTNSSQLTAIANQAIQIRQHLQQLKAAAPPIELPVDNAKKPDAPEGGAVTS